MRRRRSEDSISPARIASATSEAMASHMASVRIRRPGWSYEEMRASGSTWELYISMRVLFLF
jgi:hypothetical protein